MARPTIEGLGHATDCLEQLAWRWHQNNDNGYHRVAGLLDLLMWLDAEIKWHHDASVYGPGWEHHPEGGGKAPTHTIGRHGLNRPVESRLDWGTADPNSRNQRGGPAQPPVEPNDPVYKDLRKLQRDINSTLTSLEAQWQHRAERLGGWPHRSEVG